MIDSVREYRNNYLYIVVYKCTSDKYIYIYILYRITKLETK